MLRRKSKASDAAAQALRRDLALAVPARKKVANHFKEEARAVVMLVEVGGDINGFLDAQAPAWADTLAQIWEGAAVVYSDTLEQLTGESEKQVQELVGLLTQLARDGRPATTVSRFLEERGRGIVTRSKQRVGTLLRQVNTPSEIRALSRALRRLYLTEFVNDRAAQIALDQILRATATFEHAAALQAQVITGRPYMQVWVTQGDDKVRETHMLANGQEVALDEYFKVGGELLRYPRDPAGSPGNTYNCRCWTERRQVR